MPTNDYTISPQLGFPFPEPEEWRPVVGWEGYYEVSNLGRVRSLDQVRPSKDKKRPPRLCIQKGCLTSFFKRGNGASHNYWQIHLRRGGRRANRLVHHLVLEAFVGPRPEGWVTNHINGIPTDNRLQNLEYCTYRYNSHHARALGLVKTHGEYSRVARLTTDTVRRIRRLARAGMPKLVIAREIGVARGTVRAVLSGKTWRHVPED